MSGALLEAGVFGPDGGEHILPVVQVSAGLAVVTEDGEVALLEDGRAFPTRSAALAVEWVGAAASYVAAPSGLVAVFEEETGAREALPVVALRVRPSWSGAVDADALVAFGDEFDLVSQRRGPEYRLRGYAGSPRVFRGSRNERAS